MTLRWVRSAGIRRDAQPRSTPSRMKPQTRPSRRARTPRQHAPPTHAAVRAARRLRLARLPEGARRFRADPHAAARRGLRDLRRPTTAPTSSSSTPAASSTPRSRKSLDAIGEALAENGKVIVTGCLGAKDGGGFVRDGASEGARGHRPARDRRSDVGGARAPAEAARSVRRPRAAAGHQADADALRVPEDQRRLQPSLHVLHHPVDARRPRVSRPIGEVLAEAEHLLQAGVKELLVISQDTSAYGVDVKYRTGFWHGRPVKTRMTELATALGELAAQHGAWVRLHYVYPYPHVDEVIADDGRSGAGRTAALSRRAVPAREPAHPEADEASRPMPRRTLRAHRGVARGASRPR